MRSTKNLLITIWMVGWGCARALPVDAQTPPSLTDLCSFHLGFDGTVVAAFSRGKAEPDSIQFTQNGQTHYVKPAALGAYYVPGVQGRALSTKDRSTDITLTYPVDKNFKYAKGTILFWMSYLDLAENAKVGNMAFNQPNFGYITVNYADPRTAFVCFASNKALGGEASNGSIEAWRATPWRKGEWHQVVLTWNKDKATYYEDGVALAKANLKLPMTAPENGYPFFGVALAGWAGKNHHVVAMDEFYIFPIVLPDVLIQYNFRQIQGGRK
ncbi:MAG: LamG-like jellyroll fold domain-containing protein [Thermoguttaceae bacterium]